MWTREGAAFSAPWALLCLRRTWKAPDRGGCRLARLQACCPVEPWDSPRSAPDLGRPGEIQRWLGPTGVAQQLSIDL